MSLKDLPVEWFLGSRRPLALPAAAASAPAAASVSDGPGSWSGSLSCSSWGQVGWTGSPAWSGCGFPSVSLPFPSQPVRRWSSWSHSMRDCMLIRPECGPTCPPHMCLWLWKRSSVRVLFPGSAWTSAITPFPVTKLDSMLRLVMDEFSLSILAIARATVSSARVFARLKTLTCVLVLKASANRTRVSYDDRNH